MINKKKIKDKKIIIFGCQQIAVDVINNLLKRGFKILALVTYELPLDKKYGYASVKDIAKKHKIPVYEPEKIDEEFIKKIKSYQPDLILSIYYRKIFPAKLIKIPLLGCVNVHPSLLPYYRGPVPTLWALLNGEKECGATIHFIDEGIDTGPIIAQSRLKISNRDTGFTLNNKVMKLGYRLLAEHIEDILAGKVKTKKQEENEGSYFGKFFDSLRIMDWRKSRVAILNQVRALTKPYSGCLASILDKDIIIWQVKILKNRHCVATPAKILKVNKDKTFLVSTSDGSVLVSDYQLLKSKRSFYPDSFYIKEGKFLC